MVPVRRRTSVFRNTLDHNRLGAVAYRQALWSSTKGENEDCAKQDKTRQCRCELFDYNWMDWEPIYRNLL